MVLALLVGRFTGNPEGVTKEAVSMKKMSKRKIKSVMEAMLNDTSTLFRVFRSMGLLLARFLQQVNKLDRRILHLVNHLGDTRHQVVIRQVGNDPDHQSGHRGDHGRINP